VRPGDRDALLEAHELGEHFRAANDGQAFFSRSDKFRIIALDGSRDHDDLRRAEVFCAVTDMDKRAFAAQPNDIGALGRVRALDRVAEIEQNLGYARHAYAAYSYKMNGA
jgi:hypothetical protein